MEYWRFFTIGLEENYSWFAFLRHFGLFRDDGVEDEEEIQKMNRSGWPGRGWRDEEAEEEKKLNTLNCAHKNHHNLYFLQFNPFVEVRGFCLLNLLSLSRFAFPIFFFFF